MHFTRLLFLAATAVHGLVVTPNAAEPVGNVMARHPEELAQLLDKTDLIPRQGGGSLAGYGKCLFQFPLFGINQNRRQSFQDIIDSHGTHSYILPGDMAVEIVATYVGNDNHIGVIISSDDLLSGSIVLSNYVDTNARTPRQTIQIDFSRGTTRQCIRLPRLDGTWYVQKS
ncbi:hypothetical protein WAI453_013130 [Rhynchosporium graminicola]|uniref:Uncharacterized protein n=1 Tax=Rhynchosporium graminicola TaxID=2792576 RepID=A0A1E1K8E3_9HELO|nr:uncharacterized protein RCO7_10338 [Rhynchosporium commune]